MDEDVADDEDSSDIEDDDVEDFDEDCNFSEEILAEEIEVNFDDEEVYVKII